MKMRYRDMAFITAGGLIFLALTLIPFAFKSSQQSFIVASTLDIPNCVVNGEFPNANQCMNWIPPHFLTAIGWAGAALLVGYIVSAFQYSKRIVGRQRLYQFSMWQAIIAGMVTAITIPIYAVFRSHSQGLTIAANEQAGNSLWVPVREQLFGPGLPWAAIVVFAVLYVVGSSVQWYAVRLSPWRIAGLKKEELFQ